MYEYFCNLGDRGRKGRGVYNSLCPHKCQYFSIKKKKKKK